MDQEDFRATVRRCLPGHVGESRPKGKEKSSCEYLKGWFMGGRKEGGELGFSPSKEDGGVVGGL